MDFSGWPPVQYSNLFTSLHLPFCQTDLCLSWVRFYALLSPVSGQLAAKQTNQQAEPQRYQILEGKIETAWDRSVHSQHYAAHGQANGPLISCLIPLAQALLKWHWQWVLPPTSGTIKHCNWNSWGWQDLWILACAMDFLSLCILMPAFLQLQDLTVFSPEEGQGFCSEENPFPAPERLRQSRFWKESCLFLYLYLPPHPKRILYILKICQVQHIIQILIWEHPKSYSCVDTSKSFRPLQIRQKNKQCQARF